MSEHREQRHDCNSVCPYCGYSYQVESENFSEDTREDECGQCGKKYWLRQEFDVRHIARPDCMLNGQQHSWTTSLSVGFEKCGVCNEFRRAEGKSSSELGATK